MTHSNQNLFKNSYRLKKNQKKSVLSLSTPRQRQTREQMTSQNNGNYFFPIFTCVKLGFAPFPLTPVMAVLPVDTSNPEKDFHSSVYILDKYSACYQYRPLVGLMLCH